MHNVLQLVPEEEPLELEGNSKPLGLETLRASMPKGRRHIITQSFADTINGIVEDPEVRDAFRNNILGFTDILQDPKITLTAYIQAVRYVSYKLMGYLDFESYTKTFPERYERMLQDGKSLEHIRAIVSQYNAGKTVNLILEQVMVPTHILNYDIYQGAINEQRRIMLDPRASFQVRSNAAHSLMTTLKPPEAAKLKVDITVREDDSIRELKEVTLELARQQRDMITTGLSNAKEIAESSIIPAEFKRIE